MLKEAAIKTFILGRFITTSQILLYKITILERSELIFLFLFS